MLYKEMKNEDYPFICHSYLISSLLLRHEQLEKIIQLDFETSAKIILIKRTRHGKYTTKSFLLPIEDAVFFTAWIAEDFPDLPFEHINYKDDDNNEID